MGVSRKESGKNGTKLASDDGTDADSHYRTEKTARKIRIFLKGTKTISAAGAINRIVNLGEKRSVDVD